MDTSGSDILWEVGMEFRLTFFCLLVFHAQIVFLWPVRHHVVDHVCDTC